jgi:integrase
MDREAARIVARDRLKPRSTPPAQPEPHHDTTTRFEDFLPVFLKHSRNRWKARTHAKVTTMSRALITVFGAKPIAAIGRTEVASWLGGLKGCNIWPLCIMSSVMKHAEDLGIRPPGSNPCAGMRRKKTRFAGRHLGADDYGALGRALHKHCPMPNPAGALLRFVTLTGCRRSEAFDLQWDNLHGDRAVLADSKTGPKTIWLGTAARAVLDAMPRTDGPWIFRDEHRARRLIELYKAWHAVTAEAGLEGLRVHDLRHGFASVGSA